MGLSFKKPDNHEKNELAEISCAEKWKINTNAIYTSRDGHLGELKYAYCRKCLRNL